MTKIQGSTILAVLICCLIAGSLAQAANLERHTVTVDGHPLVVWEKSARLAAEAILLVHGRTWSALPDFDLQVPDEDLSLMDGLVERGFAVFAVDLRGYGETPRDESDWLTPNRAADDVAQVIRWISDQREWRRRPHLFGWSMGSTISQLAEQRHPGMTSTLTLFGYWRDDDEAIPADEPGIKPEKLVNTAVAAASDFITPGSISQKAVDRYVEMALAADPIKTDLRGLEQYNLLDAGKIAVPTLIIYGEFDPIAPSEFQEKLYSRIGAGHKMLVSVPGGDHAAFLETPREMFLHTLVSFIEAATIRN